MDVYQTLNDGLTICLCRCHIGSADTRSAYFRKGLDKGIQSQEPSHDALIKTEESGERGKLSDIAGRKANTQGGRRQGEKEMRERDNKERGLKGKKASKYTYNMSKPATIAMATLSFVPRRPK